jgi:hypothetical protein
MVEAAEWQRHVHEICKLFWPIAVIDEKGDKKKQHDAVVHYHVLWFPAFNTLYGPPSAIGVSHRASRDGFRIYELMALTSSNANSNPQPVQGLESVTVAWRGPDAPPETIQWQNATASTIVLNDQLSTRVLRLVEEEDGERVCEMLEYENDKDSRYDGLTPIGVSGVRVARSFPALAIDIQPHTNKVTFSSPSGRPWLSDEEQQETQQMTVLTRETLEEAVVTLKAQYNGKFTGAQWGEIGDFFAHFGFLRSMVAPTDVQYNLKRLAFEDVNRTFTYTPRFTLSAPWLAEFDAKDGFPPLLRLERALNNFGDTLHLRTPDILAQHCYWMAHWCRKAGNAVGKVSDDLITAHQVDAEGMQAIFLSVLEQTTCVFNTRQKQSQLELLEMLYWLQNTFQTIIEEYRLDLDFGSRSIDIFANGRLVGQRGRWLARVICQAMLVRLPADFNPIGTMHAWEISNLLDSSVFSLWIGTLQQTIDHLLVLHTRRQLNYGNRALSFMHVKRQYHSPSTLSDQDGSGIGVHVHRADNLLAEIRDPRFCELGFFGATNARVMTIGDTLPTLIPCPRFATRIDKDMARWIWIEKAFRDEADNQRAVVQLWPPGAPKRPTRQKDNDDDKRRCDVIDISSCQRQ